MRILLALAVFIVAGLPASACKWCMMNNQYDGSSAAPPPTHTPADVTKSPRLDADDVAYILSLEGGKRYVRLGGYIADKTVNDLWLRLLDESSVADLMKPRSAQLVAGLRAKAAKKALSKEDSIAAAHLYRDIPAASSADDWEFLRDLVASVPPSDATSHGPDVPPNGGGQGETAKQ